MHRFDKAVATVVTGLACGECHRHDDQQNAIPQISDARHTYPSDIHAPQNLPDRFIGVVRHE